MKWIDYELPAMTQDEHAFFVDLGKRIATLRKEQGLSQVQLGEMLGVSQQKISHIEVGRSRVPLSLLPSLARALAVSVEELLGEERKPGKRGPAPKLQRQLERISRLPRAKQRFVTEMLDTVLQQPGR